MSFLDFVAAQGDQFVPPSKPEIPAGVIIHLQIRKSKLWYRVIFNGRFIGKYDTKTEAVKMAWKKAGEK